jgi:drug/metabolite transporter (DMT)-like permease
MLKGVLAGLAAGALWGLVFVAPRMVTNFTPVDLAAGRFLAYGAVAAFVCASTRRPLPTASQALAALGLSILGFTGYYLLLVFAIRDAGTEVPALIIGTIPVWVMLLGKPGHLRWAALVPGIALTAAGLALMTLASPARTGDVGGARFVHGLLLAVIALACWTAFALLNAAWLKRHGDVRVTDWANWLGLATGAGALVLWLAAGSPATSLRTRPDAGLFLLLALATGACRPASADS